MGSTGQYGKVFGHGNSGQMRKKRMLTWKSYPCNHGTRNGAENEGFSALLEPAASSVAVVGLRAQLLSACARSAKPTYADLRRPAPARIA